jgi:hypothetical protein
MLGFILQPNLQIYATPNVTKEALNISLNQQAEQQIENPF